MLGKILKGAACCATLGLATIGALTLVSDDAWESFPAGLGSARSFLADFGVAPSRYREKRDSDFADSSDSAFASNGGSVFGRARVRVGGKRVADGSRFGETGDVEKFVARDDGAKIGPASESLRLRENGRSGERIETADLTNNVVIGGSTSTDEAGFNDRFDPDALVASSENVDDGANVSSADIVDRLAEENFAASNAGAVASNGESNAFKGFSDADLSFGAETSAEPALAPTNGPTTEPFGLNESSSVESSTPFAMAPIAGTGVPSVDGDGTTNGEAARAFIPTTEAGAEQTLGAFGQNPQTSPTLGGAPNVSDLGSALDAAARRETPEGTRAAFQALTQIWREERGTLPNDERTRLASELDRLAFDAFYNTAETPLEPLRVVAAGETLASIARELDATPDSLAAINGFDATSTGFETPLQPGISLKTIRGPVSAEISLRDRELTLYLDGLYAGRFTFGTPKNAVGLRGTFAVADKIVNPACNAIGADGSPVEIPGGSPDNPLGAGWISLTGEGGATVGLQGTNRPALVGQDVEENGGLLFSDREIAQLIVLLPIGATVSVGE